MGWGSTYRVGAMLGQDCCLLLLPLCMLKAAAGAGMPRPPACRARPPALCSRTPYAWQSRLPPMSLLPPPRPAATHTHTHLTACPAPLPLHLAEQAAPGLPGPRVTPNPLAQTHSQVPPTT